MSHPETTAKPVACVTWWYDACQDKHFEAAPDYVPVLKTEMERLRGLLQATGDERDALRQAMQEIVEKGPPAEFERIARKALQDE